MIYGLVFIIGLLIGSFLNVVILRYNSGDSLVKGGSRCFSCGKGLKWHELVPVFSFLAQKGKCRGCKAKISWQYPAIELLTAFLFLTSFQLLKFNSNSWEFGFVLPGYWLVISLLIVIAVYDLRHMIIPNGIVWSLNAIGFLSLLRFSPFGFEIPSFLSGILFFGFFALLWTVSKGKWMGFGDAKLALGLGWLLGPQATFHAFLYSFWIGAMVGIALLVLDRIRKKKKYSMKSQIPFGPFLIIGALLAFLLEINVLDFCAF